MANRVHRRHCQCCHAELYDDEPGSYCKDCRGVFANMRAVHLAKEPPYDEAAARERKLTKTCHPDGDE